MRQSSQRYQKGLGMYIGRNILLPGEKGVTLVQNSRCLRVTPAQRRRRDYSFISEIKTLLLYAISVSQAIDLRSSPPLVPNMTTHRRSQILRRQIALMLAVVFSLTVLDVLSYGLFFGISLLVFLVVIALPTSRVVTVPWRSRLRWLGVIGLLGYAAIAVLRLSNILSTVTVP